MHWVDRGEEPSSLENVRRTHTPKWVAYYREGGGRKPSDVRWQYFREELEKRFHGICGYCEEYVRGEVDHFRPKSKFPELVYEWSNWVFACRSCNASKKDKWPSGGYVDPCASSGEDHPETLFEFDLYTGQIVPRSDLSGELVSKARQTVKDIGLNQLHHIRKRIARIELLRLLLSILVDTPRPDVERYVERLTRRSSELSSVARHVLSECDWQVRQL